MIQRIFLTLIICTFYTLSYSQSTRFDNPGFNLSSITNGPMLANTTDSTVSRFAYILPNLTLGQLEHGDSIRTIEFRMATSGNSVTTANMKIYIVSTNRPDFGAGNIHWDSTLAQMNAVKVYDKNPASDAGSSIGYKTFPFNVAEYEFDTTGGRVHLAIFIEYFQETAATGLISWGYENQNTFFGYAFDQVKSFTGVYPFPDSTNGSSANHPEMVIHFPRNRNDITVKNIYALGKTPANTAAAEKIKVLVTNSGALTTTANNKVILNISGPNAFTDTVTVAGLPSTKDTLIEFKAVNPTKIAADNIEVKATNDDDLSNNTQNITRFVTANVFNHADPIAGASGGIGFNGGTGDFVAKFETSGATSINQVKVRFTAAGLPFKLGIWTDNNGVPGTNIFSSDTLTTNDSIYIVKIDPKVNVNGIFYVGIRQMGITNVGFGFQNEAPVRPDAFFFTSPTGGTTWTPFSPGFNFKMMIEPRLQVAHDVAIEKILPPFNDGGNAAYSVTDSLAPKALLANYGSLDQNTPFNIICNIRKGSFLIYSDTIQDTIKSDYVKQIEFAQKFKPNFPGDYTCEMFTSLSLDLVVDNDRLQTNFKVAIANDLSADAIFTPTINDTFEMGRDSFQPIIRLKNWGTVAHTNSTLTFQVLAGNKIVFEQNKLFSIGSETSSIVAFDSMIISDTFGILTMRAFTNLSGDEIPFNDTISGTLNIRKSADIAMIRILFPTYDSVFARSAVGFNPKVIISNVGVAFQDSVYVNLKIFKDSKLYYSAVSYEPINILSSRTITFINKFIPDTTGLYNMLAYVTLKGDQDSRNDTLTSLFWVKVPKDMEATALFNPVANQIMNTTFTPFKPTARITNKGIIHSDSFNTTLIITKGTNIVYQSVYRDSIPKSSTRDIEFPDLFNVNDLGNYTATMFTELVGDEINENDTIRTPFTVSRFFDVGLRKIISPVSQSSLPFENSIPLTVEVQNYGADTGKAQFDLYFVIERGVTEVYREGFAISMDSGEVRNVTMPINFVPVNNGAHVMYAFSTLSNDQRTDNDSLVGSFNINNKVGVSTIPIDKDIIAYPNPFTGTITIEALTNNIGEVNISLTNSIGVQLANWDNIDLSSTFVIDNLANLPAGFYFVTLQTETGTYRLKLTK